MAGRIDRAGGRLSICVIDQYLQSDPASAFAISRRGNDAALSAIWPASEDCGTENSRNREPDGGAPARCIERSERRTSRGLASAVGAVTPIWRSKASTTLRVDFSPSAGRHAIKGASGKRLTANAPDLQRGPASSRAPRRVTRHASSRSKSPHAGKELNHKVAFLHMRTSCRSW
jgi:hypothetical protein